MFIRREAVMDRSVLNDFDTSDEAREQQEVDFDAWVDSNSDRAYDHGESATYYEY
jgi:hypothetical protein